MNSKLLRLKIALWIQDTLQGFIKWTMNHSRLILLTSLITFGLAIYTLPELKMELDIYDILDPTLKSSAHQATMREEFEDINSIFVTLYSQSDLTHRDACLLKEFGRTYYNQSSDIKSITGPWTLRTPKLEEGKLWYFNILENPCIAPPELSFSRSMDRFKSTPWEFFYIGKKTNQISLEVAFASQQKSDGQKKFDVMAIERFVKSLDQFVREQIPKANYHIFGQVSFRWHILKIMQKDFIWNFAIIVFFIVFFYFFLGTWRSGFYYALTLIFTEVMIFGSMAVLGFPIDMMSNCLILMTSVAGVSDFLFVSSAQNPNENWEASFFTVATPSCFTSLTTVFGFLSLGLSEIPAISRFGYAAALGACFQWMGTFIVLPAFLKTFGMHKGWMGDVAKIQIKAPWFLKMNEFVPSRWLTALLVIIGLSGAIGFYYLNVGENVLRNFPSDHVVNKAYRWLQEDKDWQGQIFLVFNPSAQDSSVRNIVAKINALPNVATIENPLDVENFLTRDLKPQSLKNRVLTDLAIGPLKRYRSSAHYLRMPIYTRSFELNDLRALVKAAEELCGPHCWLAGQTVVYLEYSDRISQSLVDSMGASLITVVLLLLGLALLQGNSNYFALMISSIWGPLTMLGLFALFQVPVSSVTSIFFALIVGWTGDNAIQFLFAGEDLVAGAAERASASLMQTLLFCGSSLFLVFHTFIPMKLLGAMFVVGFFITYIGDLWILKGLLEFRKPTFK